MNAQTAIPAQAQPFRITADQAADMLALSPAARDVALQDAYNTHLIEAARIRFGAQIASPASFFCGTVARSWDRNGAAYMAEARAELDRAAGRNNWPNARWLARAGVR